MRDRAQTISGVGAPVPGANARRPDGRRPPP